MNSDEMGLGLDVVASRWVVVSRWAMGSQVAKATGLILDQQKKWSRK